MLQHALSFIERGWYIIPLSPQTTIIAKGKNMSNQEADVRQWFSECENYNIGLRSPSQSNLLVIQTNYRNDEAFIRRMIETVGDKSFNDTLTINSSYEKIGKKYRIFSVPVEAPSRVRGMKSQAKSLLPEATIHYEGGIIPLPPSAKISHFFTWEDKNATILELPATLIDSFGLGGGSYSKKELVSFKKAISSNANIAAGVTPEGFMRSIEASKKLNIYIKKYPEASPKKLAKKIFDGVKGIKSTELEIAFGRTGTVYGERFNYDEILSVCQDVCGEDDTPSDKKLVLNSSLQPKNTLSNACSFVRSLLSDSLRYNEMTDCVEVNQNNEWVVWDKYTHTIPFTERLEKENGVSFTDVLIDKAVQSVSRNNSIYPPREYLNNLPKWDGKKRIAKSLHNYFFARTQVDDYLEAVSQYMWLSMVTIAYEPGFLLHHIILLCGADGIGKKKALEIMSLGCFGHWRYGKTHPYWLAEVTSNDYQTIIARPTRKQAKSALVDKNDGDGTARKYVMIATLDNVDFSPHEYKKDFLGVLLNQNAIAIEGLRKDLPQLYAEAKYQYDKGVRPNLTDSAIALAKECTFNKVFKRHWGSKLKTLLDWSYQNHREVLLMHVYNWISIGGKSHYTRDDRVLDIITEIMRENKYMPTDYYRKKFHPKNTKNQKTPQKLTLSDIDRLRGLDKIKDMNYIRNRDESANVSKTSDRQS